MTLGLGSGRAVWRVVERLGERFGGGAAPLRVAVASERTRERARDAGLEVVELDGTLELDLALDGADEIDPELRLIKGGGGALLREKIVVAAARRFVVVAETPKKVDRLGQGFKLPVEVARFAWRDTQRRLARVLADPQLRVREGDDEPYVTDEGHHILDCPIPRRRGPGRPRRPPAPRARRAGARPVRRDGGAGRARHAGGRGRDAGRLWLMQAQPRSTTSGGWGAANQ